jgi:DNA-binding response OmpR family regulator
MCQPHRILLIDDDLDSCQMMSLLLTLENKNYHVFSAKTAREALALMAVEQFDIYILDCLLPDMPGVELCGKVRRTDKETPILFYSGMATDDYIKNAKAAGANEYLVKPNDLEKLPQTIHKYLQV